VTDQKFSIENPWDKKNIIWEEELDQGPK